MLWVVREVGCVYNRRLKVANVLDSLTAAGRSGKLKEHLQKLVVQAEILRRFVLAG